VIKKVKNYFTYNKKERNGILLLSFVLFLLLIFYQFTHLFVSETITDFSEFEKAIAELKYIEEDAKSEYKDSLFKFNPNSLNDNGWLALGLSEGKLKVLRNYQNSGGYFKQKEDLKRCYAIGDDFYNKIKNYVVIPRIDNLQTSKKEIKADNSQPITIVKIVELNQADSLQLISIKGIGPFYAKQIIKYRKELGGFLSYNQFFEIWGLDKLDLEKLKVQTQIDTTRIRKININRTEINEFRKHPYINYKEAKMIVNYRTQHGDFKSLKDIQKIKPISPEKFRKIAPYLRMND
jgi:DNA uptake protein ComE-like DNA-binding protein|tara:strand:+ start:1519 stop:2394 length:876 start_codon:yes stop_codon:yes gene_type:complete